MRRRRSSRGTQWADAALDYVALLREHIAKENNLLFVMGERLLTPADQQRLTKEFEGVDKQKMADGEGERLLRLTDNLLEDVSELSNAWSSAEAKADRPSTVRLAIRESRESMLARGQPQEIRA